MKVRIPYPDGSVVEVSSESFALAVEAAAELDRATALHGRGTGSAHESHSVLREEFEELWDEVKKGGSEPRDFERMRKEAIQVAAMGLRFVRDVVDSPGGRKRGGSL